ncbi:right-handed parallel beta-helix repeat-containing protein [Verrucomicrobiaceae bacterium 227]
MKLTTLSSAIASMTLLTAPVFGQGSLTPGQNPDHKSGPAAALDAGGLPQPTMKTLQQVEPRTDLQTLIGDEQTSYVIDKPGSYYLSQNIVSKKEIGISIRAANVVLDLNGFHLSSAGGRGAANKGVHVVPGVHAVTVRNGTVSLFKDGFAAFSSGQSNPKSCVFENLLATNCAEHGFLIGEDSVIRHCTSRNNGAGIHAESGTRISHCTVTDCQGYGEGKSLGSAIFARNCCIISHCILKNNAVRGLVAGTTCVIEHTSACGNTGQYGIMAGDDSVLRHCTANGNIGSGGFSRGISLGKGCSAIACNANNNKGATKDPTGSFGVGIYATSDCLIKNCTVKGNDGDGIRVGSNNRIEENQSVKNGAAGIRVTGDCNRVDSNHCGANDHGIYFGGVTGNFIIRNSSLKNTSTQFFRNGPGNTAPSHNISGGAISDNPWENFYLNN